MKKAVTYLRVSSQEQAQDDKFSIPNQDLDTKNYCERNGYNLINKYTDIESGLDIKKDRQQFEQMLRDAKAGQFDTIIVWRPDRIFRGLTPAAKLAKVLDETGIEIEGVMQPLDRRTIGLWAWVAEQEIQTMKDRFDSGKRGAVQMGKWSGGGFIKLGYKYNSNRQSPDYTGKLNVNETEAKIVLTIFQKVDQGMKLRPLAIWLNKEGIPTKRRGMWAAQNLSLILRDRIYIGEGTYGKLIRKGNRFVKSDKTVPMPCPLIIPLDLFNRVQARLSHNQKKNSGGAKNFYILQHFGKCGECGGSLVCQNIAGYRYIHCIRQQSYPHLYQCYQPKNHNLDIVENYVFIAVQGVLEDYRFGVYNRLIDSFNSALSERQERIATAKGKMDSLKWERQRVLTQVRKDNVTEQEADIQFTKIKEEEEHWRQEVANFEVLSGDALALHERFCTQLKTFESKFDTWAWADPTPQEKREILTLLLKEFVMYNNGRIELRLKLPVSETQIDETFNTLSHNNKAIKLIKTSIFG
ncbi:recombinase family protein [Chloroflexota bacterium]